MGFWRCCVYYAALGAAFFFFGWLLTKSWFHGDRFPFGCSPKEAKLYRLLRVHDWQDKAPDMSRIVPKLIPAKRLTGSYRAQLPRIIQETCVAELTHVLLSVCGLYALRLWPGAGGVLITAVYILFGNVPFIIIQRYNRPRLQRLEAMQRRKGEKQ